MELERVVAAVVNDLLASDTIRNWTIVDPECTAHVRLLLPLSADLGTAMEILLEEARSAVGASTGRDPSVRASGLVGNAAGTRAELAPARVRGADIFGEDGGT